MLRSSLLPLSSSFQPKFKLKLELPSTAISKYSTTSTIQCPQPVCQNSSLTSLPASAYIHLPFCRKRCHYCDFPIVALGSSSSSDEDDPRISNYIKTLLREIQATHPTPTLPHPPLQTIFFGGGTPSLVPPRLIASVLDLLRSKFGIKPDAEVSIEMDPGTFDKQKLIEILGLGINRVSLGVQAFQEELLRSCGRAHGLREVEEAVELVSGCEGVKNWSLDLISSLPHQSEKMWEESLRRAVDAQPTHVSVYDLQVEQGTKFDQLYKPGEFPLPTETQSADFYRIASERLTGAGYEHYEISSYCKKGYECKHNVVYWQNKPFYGFGLGSASYINGVRFSRPRRLKEYTAYVVKLEEENGEADAHASPNVEAKDMALDVVMLSLRTARGLDVSSFSETFGMPLVLALCEAFGPYVNSGHMIAMDAERRRLSLSEFESWMVNDGDDDKTRKKRVGFIRLSDPDGFLLSNELISIAFRVISP